MHLKRLAFLLLLTALLLFLIPASAGTYYVYTENGKTLNLRSPVDDSVIGHIPYGTKLETDDHLSTETAAYVTYKGVSGYVKWAFLVKDPPKPRNTSATPAPVENAYPTGQGSITIQAVGCTVGYASGGGAYSEISYDTPVMLKITAAKKPAYWVINGIRYDFEPYIPSSFTLDNAWESMTIEAVMKNQQSSTLLSSDDIQAARTGDRLVVQTVRAKLCHLNAKDYGAGGWITSFDFTDDFTNRATKKNEQGGRVTIRVQAVIPSGKKISYWLFDDAKLDFNTNVTQFIVRDLNVSKLYEPVFGGSTTATVTRAPAAITTRPQQTVTESPGTTREPATITTRPQAKTYYTVTCTNCTFSGGGASGSSSARVEAGTQITVTATSGGVIDGWKVNGSTKLQSRNVPFTGASFTMTVEKDTTIVCVKSRTVKHTVSCTNCTFSGGGYSGATSGSVPDGTQITVTATSGGTIEGWTVNGSTKLQSREVPYTGTSFTVTVEKDTTIFCIKRR